jgi:hypothetical protein
MSLANAHHPRHGRLLDRLFVGGCTAAYLVLIGAVVVGLRLVGS